ncbi:hypothetical protein GOP47_0021078 [Adiantum capillus-veneris]|uniref:RRM domain-containing protein n=1 Tax=Adiantum capillus-veneris TaxID=13818 RepID=A0A9D4UAF2_ADICA|nr:hypothetical protein GOP47_0021078 [Adiantum capillus-veneris]
MFSIVASFCPKSLDVRAVPTSAGLKTEKGKMDALNLKTLVIQDETLFLEGLTGVAVEEKSRADLGSASLSKETSIPDLPALENSTSDVTAECFDFSKQRHFWNLSVQNSIIIEDYPMKVPLKSIYDFFSVFGELQMFYGKGTIFIKFKDECDKEKALKVHQFVVDGCSFRIKTDVSSDELVIRLYSVKVEADKMKAMNACSKYGSIKYINHDRIGVLFAHYKVTEKQRAKEILNRKLQGNLAIRSIILLCDNCEAALLELWFSQDPVSPSFRGDMAIDSPIGF